MIISIFQIISKLNYIYNYFFCRYGIQNESIASQAFEKIIGCSIQPAGLFIDVKIPFLAASPDGLINNNALVEIKCPSSIKDYTPEEAYNLKKLKYIDLNDGKFVLKKNDNFYYQIQGQLHITGRDIGYFIVWTPKGKTNFLLKYINIIHI